MPTKTAPSALTLPQGLRFSSRDAHQRTAAAVVNSPRLLAALPAAELAPLFTAYEGATKARAAAQALRVESTDVLAEVDAQLRQGAEIDPAALVARLGEAQAAAARRDQTVALLESLPRRYTDEIAGVIADHVPALYDALSADLAELLDEAEAVVSELGTVSDADGAISAGKVAEWTKLRELAARYADLRADHVRLLRLEDTGPNFANGAPSLGFAFFGGLDDVVPGFAKAGQTPTADLMGRPVTSEPFPVLDVTSVAHFLAVVRLREELAPHVIGTDEASDLRAEAAGRIVDRNLHGVSRAPSERDAYTLRRVRMAAADQIAEARESIALGLTD
ncbi:hypothetical protein SAMN05660350_01087 [Geodermatophilus obscurus]|uniref:Uncharacterized protein n=1 Tax=Geodermatophilus obscurus TaxID=1861 RepID=A0A1M7SWB5_9ACTN|nr:hypothetical protein [Geodermatophilus obscurus]SHN62740.1 hypothetical protein SAMN05660350_01087 [Geodermatophilus obscurus]